MSRYIDIEPYEKDGWYLQKYYHNEYCEVVKTTPLISVPTADPVVRCEVDDSEIAHCENCKYEDAVGGMTNRQYLATLSNEELANAIYDVIVDRIGWRYTSSKQGVSQWLGELYREDDFKKFVYYADNKKIMDGREE